jgi:hypothetical protein
MRELKSALDNGGGMNGSGRMMNPAAASNYSMPRPAGPVIGPPKRRKPRGFLGMLAGLRGKNSVGPAGGGFSSFQPRVAM